MEPGSDLELEGEVMRKVGTVMSLVESKTYELWGLDALDGGSPEVRALIEAKIRVYRQAVELALARAVLRGTALRSRVSRR